MVPWIISTDIYHWFYTGGAFRPELAATWAASVSDRRKNLHGSRADEEILCGHLPAREADDAWREDLPFYDTWVDHDLPGEPYTSWLPLDASSRVKAPMMLVAGWFDLFGPDQIRDWQGLRANPDAADSVIVVGPWNHALGMKGRSDLDFGREASALRVVPWLLEWYDHHLAGTGPDVTFGPFRSFEVGSNTWHDSATWPPAGSVPHRLDLASNDTLLGPVTQDTDPRLGPEATVTFRYDPSDPVPTTGGRAFLPRLALPKDQSSLDDRRDVLRFRSNPLPVGFHVAGGATAHLCVSSSREETAFTARLVDVFPNGRAIGMMDGIRLLSRRDGEDRPAPGHPGTSTTVDIDLGQMSWYLPAGHALRLDVSSSNWPRFSATLNQSGPWALLRSGVVAEQTLHMGGTCPSWVRVEGWTSPS